MVLVISLPQTSSSIGCGGVIYSTQTPGRPLDISIMSKMDKKKTDLITGYGLTSKNSFI